MYCALRGTRGWVNGGPGVSHADVELTEHWLVQEPQPNYTAAAKLCLPEVGLEPCHLLKLLQ